MRFSRLVCATCCFSTFSYCLWSCPYSKVEESFQIQATHDLFYHGISPALVTTKERFWDQASSAATESDLPYDHLQFPGVVPRTFVGPLILSSICWVVSQLLRCCGLLGVIAGVDVSDPEWIQFLARFALMMLTFHGFLRMAGALDEFKGRRFPGLGNAFLLVTACQFHLPFYASRMLPNTFALIICLHAYTSWLRGNIPWAARYLVTATAVFRCDMLLLLGSIGLTWLIRRELTIVSALSLGITTGIINLAMTVPLDSLLWQRWVWPEGEVFFFNTVLNKSSEWGVSAWHWYLTSALPKALLGTALLVPLSVVCLPEQVAYWERRWRTRKSNNTSGHKQNSTQNTKATTAISKVPWFDTTCLPFAVASTGFVGLYSCLGHKEVRFLFPVLPLFNVLAAAGAVRIYGELKSSSAKEKSNVSSWGAVVMVLGAGMLLATTLAVSLVFIGVSQKNYPGGLALERLAQHVSTANLTHQRSDPIRVFVDVSAAMTGVSLFGQRALAIKTGIETWEFVKAGYEEENLRPSGSDMLGFSYLILEPQDDVVDNFEVIEEIPGSPRLNVKAMRIDTSVVLHILKSTSA